MVMRNHSQILVMRNHSQTKAMSLGIKGKGVEVNVFPLIIMPNYLLTEFLLPISKILNSPGLEVLVFKVGIFQPEKKRIIPLNQKMRLSPGHLGLLMPMNQ